MKVLLISEKDLTGCKDIWSISILEKYFERNYQCQNYNCRLRWKWWKWCRLLTFLTQCWNFIWCFKINPPRTLHNFKILNFNWLNIASEARLQSMIYNLCSVDNVFSWIICALWSVDSYTHNCIAYFWISWTLFNAAWQQASLCSPNYLALHNWVHCGAAAPLRSSPWHPPSIVRGLFAHLIAFTSDPSPSTFLPGQHCLSFDHFVLNVGCGNLPFHC